MSNEKNNWISIGLDYVKDLFEHMSPSLFALMATLLPYLSPLPIAIFTAGNATRYLGFTPIVSGIFVFVLECLGLWVTSVLVDSVIEFIRSRNLKTGIMIIIFGAVTGVYISILINLNVNLELSDKTKVIDGTYTRVITLISFIPLLTGFMNGWHKAKLEGRKEQDKLEKRREHVESVIRQQQRDEFLALENKKRQERIVKAAIKKGMSAQDAVLFMQETFVPKQAPEMEERAPAPSTKKHIWEIIGSSDWRMASPKLTPEMKVWIANARVEDVMAECRLSKRSAYDWMSRCKKGK